MHAGRQLDRHGSFISLEKDAQTKPGYPNSLLFFAHSFVLLFHFFNLEKNIREQNLSMRLALHNLTLPFTIDSDRATKKRLREKKSGRVETHCCSFEWDQRHKMSLLPGHFFTCDCFPLFPLSTIFQTFPLYMWRYTFPSHHFFFSVSPESSLFEVAPLKNPCQCILLWSLKRWCEPCCCRNWIFYILLNLNLTALTS